MRGIPCRRWCGRNFESEVNRDRHERVREGRCWEAYQARVADNPGDIQVRPPEIFAPPQDQQAFEEPMDLDEFVHDEQGGGEVERAAERADGEDGERAEDRVGGEQEEAADERDPWMERLKKQHVGKHIVIAQDAAEILEGRNPTFMERFAGDDYAEERKQIPYYPFASREEWQLAEYLSSSTLSMRAINDFLKLELIQNLGLSFDSAKELRSRVELLPKGPIWKKHTIATSVPTKKPAVLHYRDPLDVVQMLLENPLVRDHIGFHPFQVFATAAMQVREYTSWLSGKAAWEMQAALPAGAALCGIVLSSDKTNISAMTGNRVGYPLLLSLANFDEEYRMKATNHAYQLIALLPVVKFIHSNQRVTTMLSDRLYHDCVAHVIAPLKKAAEIGVILSDPMGYKRRFYTPLAAKVVDTPESKLVAGVAANASSVTTAMTKDWGKPERYPARNYDVQYDLITGVDVDPEEYGAYITASVEVGLNGVYRLYHADWALCDMSVALTPEPLHHWLKFSWDHVRKWCLAAVGPKEVDFRYSVLSHHSGYRSFYDGIATLKQVTGRDHQEFLRYLVPVIAGAVRPDFLAAIRTIIEFQYFGNARLVDDNLLTKMENTLHEFHTSKQAILDAGARRGESGDPINNWEIPKLEFFLSVVPNMRMNGVCRQWSAQATEHEHIKQIKDPARASNKKNYSEQICRYLDRNEKCRRFDLVTAIERAVAEKKDEGDERVEEDIIAGMSFEELELVGSWGKRRMFTDYFQKAALLLEELPRRKLPLLTFAHTKCAFHLDRRGDTKQISIDEGADLYGLPDFRRAIADFVTKLRTAETPGHIGTVGGRRLAREDAHITQQKVQFWRDVRLQTKDFHSSDMVLESRIVKAYAPSNGNRFGDCDAVIVNLDPTKPWPQPTLKGHCVARLRAIFRLVPLKDHEEGITDQILCYVHRYDIISQLNPKISGSNTERGPYPDPSTGCYLLKPSRRANGDAMADIVPLRQIQDYADLVPHFGENANVRATKSNVLDMPDTNYYLNKYFTQNLFFSLTQ